MMHHKLNNQVIYEVRQWIRECKNKKRNLLRALQAVDAEMAKIQNRCPHPRWDAEWVAMEDSTWVAERAPWKYCAECGHVCLA